MTRVDDERAALLVATDLDAALLAGSNLPGPRANLELVQAAADVGAEPDFRRWLATDPDAGDAMEFLPVCALVGFGRLAAERQPEALAVLRAWAGDPHWRIREAVAMGLQRLGDADVDRLLAVVADWGGGSAFDAAPPSRRCASRGSSPSSARPTRPSTCWTGARRRSPLSGAPATRGSWRWARRSATPGASRSPRRPLWAARGWSAGCVPLRTTATSPGSRERTCARRDCRVRTPTGFSAGVRSRLVARERPSR